MCQIIEDASDIGVVVARIVSRFAALEARRLRQVEALGRMLSAAVTKRPEFPSTGSVGIVEVDGEGGGRGGVDHALGGQVQGQLLAKALNDYFEEEYGEEELVGGVQQQVSKQLQSQKGSSRFLRADVIRQ